MFRLYCLSWLGIVYGVLSLKIIILDLYILIDIVFFLNYCVFVIFGIML